MSDRTSNSSAEFVLLTRLADEFAARYRAGERPSLQEYIDRHPELAEDILELFPAMVEIEQVKENRQDFADQAASAAAALRQLGDYRILREVGRGGMGVVYEAEQVSLERHVALKVLPPQVSQDLKSLARFRREARSAAQLHHTNIVPVFEVGKDGEVSYYAMQFIQGQGLDLVIDELRRLKDRTHPSSPTRGPELPEPPISPGPTAPAPSGAFQVSRMAHSLLTGRFEPETPGGPGETRADSVSLQGTTALSDRLAPDGTGAAPASNVSRTSVSSSPSSVVLPGGSQLPAVESDRQSFFRSVGLIGRQVAAGLAYAHARGIVHRDIKPSNLLLDTEGVVWITDFGLAKASDEGLTQTGDILGTIRYMAPERFRGMGDGRADVYALGLTIYELLTLRPAFDSPDRLKLIEQIKVSEPERPRSLDPRIPLDLETIILKAVDKDPDRRYPTADALAEDLRRFLADEPIQARRVGPGERLWRWSRRNPAVTMLLLLVALLLIGATVGSSIAALRFRRLADSERDAHLEALSRSAESDAVQGFVVDDLLGAAAGVRARGVESVTVADVLTRAEARIDRKFPDHPLVEAAIRETLGKIRYAMGHYPDAERHLARAYELRYPIDSSSRYTVRSLELLAFAAVRCNDPVRLADLERRTLEIAPDPHRRMHSLGLVDAYLIHGQHEPACALLERIVDADRQQLGGDDPITLGDEVRLGYALRHAGATREAAIHAKHVLDVGRRATGHAAAEAGDQTTQANLATPWARARLLLDNLDPTERQRRRPPLTVPAPFRTTSPVADGQIRDGEYGAEVGLGDPIDDRNPWRLFLPSRNRSLAPNDLSAGLSAAHTLTHLYLAFRVRDQFRDHGVTTDPVWNDHVEVFLDGDQMPNDFFIAGGSREGFQLIVDTRGLQWTCATDIFNRDWNVGISVVPGGYIVEFEIPLDLIDTQDGPGSCRPKTGSRVLMNAAIADNDADLVYLVESYATLWSQEEELSPFLGGEDLWVVALELTP